MWMVVIYWGLESVDVQVMRFLKQEDMLKIYIYIYLACEMVVGKAETKIMGSFTPPRKVCATQHNDGHSLHWEPIVTRDL